MRLIPTHRVAGPAHDSSADCIRDTGEIQRDAERGLDVGAVEESADVGVGKWVGVQGADVEDVALGLLVGLRD